MADPADKKALLIALKRHLEAEISRTQAKLDICDSSQDRIHLSDCRDNLRALERTQDPERSILVLETEEQEFYLDRLSGTRRYLDLVAKVPYPLSGSAVIEGREYRLSRHSQWHESVCPGAQFDGSTRRDERWTSRSIVRSKI
ncbi:hypothetical protein GLA29479_145 [Lysobacter antibioticus]|uniref:hypothetical protein n=1 Tax=Lysobacter antibioticus TaxID=84531 RepID=UPI000717115A|nr:hypothetical protein [Lysobacter antibioticus]ALN61033.1 hypothetical protein GLA29479_145 [Lysobacter antibioticus]